MPFSADHRSPVDDVTFRSNARVTALSDAAADSAGAPEAGYGPISEGKIDQKPGVSSGPETVALAESPDEVAAMSGSPLKFSMSNVTGALLVALPTSSVVWLGTK